MGDRILFLDMDGVVLNGRELWRTKNNRYIPPEKISLVREVCERAGALVVVSSTWRYSDETADLLRFHGVPLHTDWRTDWRSDYVGSIIMGQRRGVEIHRWLAKHPDTASYAIVDDDSDMLPEQASHFVQTQFETGIEREHAERLIAILSVDSFSGTATGPCAEAPTAKDAAAPSFASTSTEDGAAKSASDR